MVSGQQSATKISENNLLINANGLEVVYDTVTTWCLFNVIIDILK